MFFMEWKTNVANLTGPGFGNRCRRFTTGSRSSWRRIPAVSLSSHSYYAVP